MYFYYFCYGEREADTDLFSSVVHHSIGQQISTKGADNEAIRARASYGLPPQENCISGPWQAEQSPA